MKNLKKTLLFLLVLIITVFQFNITFAHSGRTDSSGGHHDYKNASGLGSYHYHCGGYPAHLHKNGICPYTSNTHTSHHHTAHVKKITTSKYYKKSTVKKVQKKLRKLGYKCGKPDGKYDKKLKKSIKQYQRSYYLTANGKINKKLLKKMRIRI